MSPNLFFLLASVLFSLGIVGVISRRNLFVIYMSIELMLSAVGLILVIFSKVLGDANGSVMALLLIAAIASEAALFLAMIVHMYRYNNSLDSDKFSKLQEVKYDA